MSLVVAMDDDGAAERDASSRRARRREAADVTPPRQEAARSPRASPQRTDDAPGDASRRRRRGGSADGGASASIAEPAQAGEEVPASAVAPGRRRRQRGRDSVTSETAGELPVRRELVSTARATAGAVPLWTAGDRAPLLPVSELQADIDEQLSAPDVARLADGGAMPEGEAPGAGAGGGAPARGTTSRYVQD